MVAMVAVALLALYIIGFPVNLLYQEDSSLLLEYDSRDGIVSVLLHGGHLKSIAISSEEYWVMR